MVCVAHRGWWEIRQQALSPKLTEKQVSEVMRKELRRFAGSVEYGLASYPGKDGGGGDLVLEESTGLDLFLFFVFDFFAERLASEMMLHYGDLGKEPRHHLAIAFSILDAGAKESHGDLGMKPRHHLAIAFSILDADYQPVEAIKALSKGSGTVVVSSVPPGEEQVMKDALRASFTTPLTDKGFPPLMPDSVSLVRSEVGFELPVKDLIEGLDPSGAFLGDTSLGVVKRERPMEPVVYATMGFAGMVCCAFMHGLVVPIDVVKTRMQTTPGRYKSLVDGVQKIWKEEGLKGVAAGFGPTIAGYSIYGVTVYPGYEMFKRIFISAVGEANDAVFHVPLVLAAASSATIIACHAMASSATIIACLAVCPAEVTRIRMVSNPGFADGGGGLAVAMKIVEDEGFFRGLYEGFAFLVTRQVLFGMVKFLVFDLLASWVLFGMANVLVFDLLASWTLPYRVLFGMVKFLVFDLLASWIFATFPVMGSTTFLSLTVSLISGAVAGVGSTIVSQPADTVLTKMKENSSVDAATF
ncbi:mitochondrial carrier domain-containing protein [Baffinella frigidus]|nr:mitochondrial carrier domain-containing protein [Cryptophyta sp. CCMP2293]